MSKFSLLKDILGEVRVKFDESLYYQTFTKDRSLAKAFYVATNQGELIRALDAASDLKIPFLVIGSGTKIAIAKRRFEGIVIKNRTAQMKTVGVKGKVGRGVIGVEEAVIEVDSGVTLKKLNESLKEQDLAEIKGNSSLNSTIGGSFFWDLDLQKITQKIQVWSGGEVFYILRSEMKTDQVIISVIFKFKSVKH